MPTFITVNAGSIHAAAGANTEFCTDRDGAFLEEIYTTALPLYTQHVPEATDPLVAVARELVYQVCDIRDVPFSEGFFPAKGEKLADLRRHPSGLPNACIFSSVDIVIVRRLHAVPATDDKIAMLARYMHEQAYYAAGRIDEHLVFHALRNALLVLHPEEASRFLTGAHSKYMLGVGQFKDVFGAKKHAPDVILVLEAAPLGSALWKSLKLECLPDNIKYGYEDVLAVDPSSSNDNQIGILARVPFEVNKSLVNDTLAACDADESCNIDFYALRAARTGVFVTSTHVHIAWHGRDTKNGDTHGAWVASWVASLYRAAAAKYPTRTVIVSGDFNFMSFSAAAVAQQRLGEGGYLCGNTSVSAAYGATLKQTSSMLRTRKGLGTDQFSKIGVKNDFPKITSVVRSDAARQEPRTRIAAHTSLGAAIGHVLVGGWIATVLAAFLAVSQSTMSHKRGFVAFLHGDAKSGTPGPETPLDHLPLVMKVRKVEPTSYLTWSLYAISIFTSILILFV